MLSRQGGHHPTAAEPLPPQISLCKPPRRGPLIPWAELGLPLHAPSLPTFPGSRGSAWLSRPQGPAWPASSPCAQATPESSPPSDAQYNAGPWAFAYALPLSLVQRPSVIPTPISQPAPGFLPRDDTSGGHQMCPQNTPPPPSMARHPSLTHLHPPFHLDFTHLVSPPSSLGC